MVDQQELYSISLDYKFREKLDYKLVLLHSGEECIAELKRQQPDIIVLDYNLPGMNGLDTFREIKKINKNVPVVVLSDLKDSETELTLIEEGVYSFIQKDERVISELTGVIEEILATNSVENTPEKSSKLLLWILAAVAILIMLFFGLNRDS